MAEKRKSSPAPPSGDAYARLLDELRRGRLTPGERITEADLAERLSTSRTPVREAIRLLEADGLISHRPRVGATVRRLDTAEITELYEMRAVLEATAARFAARGAYPSEIDELEAINEAMAADLSNVDALTTLNLSLHELLRRAARNHFLLRAVESMEKTLLILGPSTLEAGERAAAAVAEHAAIITALRAQDGDAAEAAMRAHIEAAHRARLRQLRERTHAP